MIASFSTSHNWGELFFLKQLFLVINVIVLKRLHNCDSNLELANGNMDMLEFCNFF